jgi:hypothetical protein
MKSGYGGSVGSETQKPSDGTVKVLRVIVRYGVRHSTLVSQPA